MGIRVKGTDTGAIDAGTSRAVERVRGASPAAASNTPGTTQTADSVSITGAARSLAALQELVTAAPDINVGRVDQLRQSIDLGTYVPNAAKIADRMIQLERDIGAATARPAR